MGLFGKKKAAADDLLALEARLGELERQLQAADERVDRLRHDFSEERLEAVDQHAKVVDRFERLERDHALLVHEVDLVESRAGGRLDALAHQIHELGRDVDTLADLPSARDGIVLDRLRAAQTALANEQARQQIALREDLAALADQLRRSR